MNADQEQEVPFRDHVRRIADEATTELHPTEIVKVMQPLLETYNLPKFEAYCASPEFRNRDAKEQAYSLLYAYLHTLYRSTGTAVLEWIRDNGIPRHEEAEEYPRLLLGAGYTHRRTLSNQILDAVAQANPSAPELLRFIESEFGTHRIQSRMNSPIVDRGIIQTVAKKLNYGNALSTLGYYSFTALGQLAKHIDGLEKALIREVNAGNIPPEEFARSLEISIKENLLPLAQNAHAVESAVLEYSTRHGESLILTQLPDRKTFVTFNMSALPAMIHRAKALATFYPATGKRGRCPLLFLEMFTDILDSHIAYRVSHPPLFEIGSPTRR